MPLRSMTANRRPLLVAAVLSICGVALIVSRGQVASDTLPTELNDRVFWQMVTDFSEPDGLFRSDNFVSNERTYQEVIPELKRRALPNGVYLGVGPDQNFTYIAALQPRMTFIIDIRRQNLIQHLLFKAIVEMSDSRRDFLGRLFSRPMPTGLDDASSPKALFDGYDDVEASETLFQKNRAEIENWLVTRHGFTLTPDDLRSLEYVYRAFFSEGSALRYSFPRRRLQLFPTYAELGLAVDRAGVNHSYLASEQNFRILRDVERRNLLVPIVGDFGGNKAIRAVGRYLTEHGATVNYFYTSNVEQYLFDSDAFRRYYANVATLPLGQKSTFIRAYFDAGFVYPPGIVTADLHSVQLLDSMPSLLNAFGAGEVGSYKDLVARSK
jgi:hypothetical protein